MHPRRSTILCSPFNFLDRAFIGRMKGFPKHILRVCSTTKPSSHRCCNIIKMIIITEYFVVRCLPYLHFCKSSWLLDALLRLKLSAFVYISGQDGFIIQHDGKPPLRGAICDIWEPTRRQSPRYTDLWHSTNEARREGAVLLEVGVIAKQAYLQVPQSYDPDVAGNLGLRPGVIYFASCSRRLH